MNKFFICAFLLTAVFANGQSAITMDQAVESSVQYFYERFPRGTRVAIINVQSENQALGEYVYRRLSASLVNSNWFTVVERSQDALESIEREMERHLNFYVSEETELSIGRQLGAEIIISSSFSRFGQNWRLDLQALGVETAERAAHWSVDIIPDSAWASFASPRTASLSFDGDPLAPRDRHTVITGLRNAMQAWEINLDLDENALSGSGYNFAIIIFFSNPTPRLIQAEVTVVFSHGDRMLRQTGPYNIIENTEALVARRIAERLREDQLFFNRINEAIR